MQLEKENLGMNLILGIKSRCGTCFQFSLNLPGISQLALFSVIWHPNIHLQDCDLVKNYVLKIQELEGQLLRLQSVNDVKRNEFIDCLDLEDDKVMEGSGKLLNAAI